MYQIELSDNSPSSFVYTLFFADVKDKLTTSITYLSAVSQFLATPYFLIEYKSQLTGKIKRFNPLGVLGRLDGVTHDDRYLWFLSKASLTESDDVANGLIKVGTTDMPYGFYDFKIYEMSSAGDYDPDNALATLFTGLMNLSAKGDYKQSVEYSEYTTNDSDTESVYITI
tara:strand:- start:270 stop:779 length:510 start_codon:yes stop_codon:yes gene_type:complete